MAGSPAGVNSVGQPEGGQRRTKGKQSWRVVRAPRQPPPAGHDRGGGDCGVMRSAWFRQISAALHSSSLFGPSPRLATLAGTALLAWPVCTPSHQSAKLADLTRCKRQQTPRRPGGGHRPMGYGLHLWLETTTTTRAVCRPRWRQECDAAVSRQRLRHRSQLRASHSPEVVRRLWGAVMWAPALRREPRSVYAKQGATEPLGNGGRPAGLEGAEGWSRWPPAQGRGPVLIRSAEQVRQQERPWRRSPQPGGQ